jgi:diguanylate cyclase (GGDEF)-like protein
MMEEEWETRENPQIVQKVREAQVQQLYKQTWTGLTGVLVVAISICVVLWQVVPQWKLSMWIGILTLITLSRGFLTLAFQRKAPIGADINRWAALHVIGTAASGLMWAIPSLLLWPENAVEHQFVWAICILPLSASAVSTYYTWKPSYLSFLFLSALPLSLRFFSEGGLLYVVLGCLALFFIAVLIQAGNLIHAASIHTLIVGFRNEALSSFLTEEKLKQEELTQQLQTAHDQLHKLSLTDELTGLWNRRYLNATIQEDVAQVIRYYRNFLRGMEKINPNNTDIVFIMVDLDHFKVVNDTHGHAAGDQVLIQMRTLLTQSCRDTDSVIRWGGEEFLVVSRNARGECYTLLVERIRRAIETHPFDIGIEHPIHLTCSIGAAVFLFLSNCPEALSWDKVVDLADACLYAAKRSGRNTWVGITSTDLASSADLSPDLAKNLPHLVREGKLEMKTNLPDKVVVSWAD